VTRRGDTGASAGVPLFVQELMSPHSLPTPCRHPGCSALSRSPRCEEHEAQRQRCYDQERGSAAKRGYGSKWRKLRARFLRVHPICMEPGCSEEATEVDHIVPRAHGGADAWDNLQALCKSHHSQKTAREDGRWG